MKKISKKTVRKQEENNRKTVRKQEENNRSLGIYMCVIATWWTPQKIRGFRPKTT